MKQKSFLQLQAYEYIKEKILSGELLPDTLYSETKLSAQIGVSRTPMREALQCLSQDGYITIVPSKGFQIRQLNEQDMLESIQVRCAIEGYCTHVISNEITTPKAGKLLEELQTILREMERTSKNPEDLEAFIDYDHQFHMCLVHYVDNDEFNQLFQRLLYLIHLTSTSALTVEGRIAGTLAEHTAYFNALKDGDRIRAYDIMIEHLTMPINVHR